MTPSSAADCARRRKERHVWVAATCVRLACASTVATFFQPDEYYQSLEPAWRIAFGRESGAWMTWEWQNQLRSSLHPLLVAAVYHVAVMLGWVMSFSSTLRVKMLLYAPKVAHACFAVAMDYSTWRLAEIVFGAMSVEADAALALSIFSPWQWFVSTRSLTNNLEASLTAMAFVWFPWSWIMQPRASSKRVDDAERVKYCIILAATATILRPTNILVWAVLTLSLACYATLQEILILSQDLAFYGTGVLVVTFGLDRLYYGVWTFPAGRFLYFNLSQDLAVFYGRNRPDYYLTEGLPIILTTALPFVITGIFRAFVPSSSHKTSTSSNAGANAASIPQQRSAASSITTNPLAVLRILAVTALAYPLTLSAISHKEVRFLHPVLPLLLILAARPLATFFHPFPRPASISKRLLLLGLVVLTISFTGYISNVHQRGVLDVLAYLRSQSEVRNADALDSASQQSIPTSSYFGHVSLASLLTQVLQPTPERTNAASRRLRPHSLNPMSVAFLMPCHSTPWRSHLIHPDIHAWALTCEPPLHVPLSERSKYMDEADVFYADPAGWLRQNMDMSTLPLSHQGWRDGGWDREHLLDLEGSASQRDKGAATPKRPWPRYLVMFEQLEDQIWEFLEGEIPRNGDGGEAGGVEDHRIGYSVCGRWFNSHWHDDWRRRGDVVILCTHRSEDEPEVPRASIGGIGKERIGAVDEGEQVVHELL